MKAFRPNGGSTLPGTDKKIKIDALECVVSVLADIRNTNPGIHVQYAATAQIFPLCIVLLK